MNREAPTGKLDGRFSSPGASPIAWQDAERHLQAAEIYWISTIRPESRPHVTPLIGLWHDGAFYFSTGEEERKGKNLALNPQVVITAAGTNAMNGGLDVILEGQAVNVTDESYLQGIADAYVAKYGEGWRFEVRDGGFYHRPGAPTKTGGWEEAVASVGEEPGRAIVFEVSPETAFAFGRGELFSQTRWQFYRRRAVNMNQ